MNQVGYMHVGLCTQITTHIETTINPGDFVHLYIISEALPDTSSGQDNRNLVSANSDNQSLGKDEIIALRKDGLTGDVS